MTTLEKYNKAFYDAFGVAEDKLPELEYGKITEWDSVAHMELMATLEDTFEITMEMDDIINFSSYRKGKEILAKYGVAF